MTNKISCIIPAYNEEERIKNVLNVVKDHPKIDEVIVINDGSTDKTKEVIESFGKFKKIKPIIFEKNKGKSFAVMTGIKRSKNNTLLFLDSDLVGLTKKNVTDLIMPVTNEEVDMTLSLRKNSLPIYRWISLDYVSGERVYKKSMIKDYKKLANIPGYGIETFLNDKIVKNNWKIRVVNWKNVICTPKSKKIGFIRGNIGEIKMVMQIVKMKGIFGVLKQVTKMLSLKS